MVISDTRDVDDGAQNPTSSPALSLVGAVPPNGAKAEQVREDILSASQAQDWSLVQRLLDSLQPAGMRTQVMEVTPPMAADFLARNKNIRKINKARVASLEEDMRRGVFGVTALGLVFNQDGDLVNGQHRLTAQIRADVTLTYNVTTGCTDEQAIHMDNGLARSMKDVLRMDKEPIQVARLLNRIMTRNNQVLSADQTLRIIESMGQGANDAFCRGSNIKMQAPLRAAFVLGYPLDPDLLTKSWKHLVDRDTDLSKTFTDPSAALRITIESMIVLAGQRVVGTGSHSTLAPNSSLGVFYKMCNGVNALLTGAPLKSLRVARGGYEAIVKRRNSRGIPPIHSFGKITDKPNEETSDEQTVDEAAEAKTAE